jgi:hypothetical protein
MEKRTGRDRRAVPRLEEGRRMDDLLAFEREVRAMTVEEWLDRMEPAWSGVTHGGDRGTHCAEEVVP